MHGGWVDSDKDRERLRQRMDDLLRDARALRALIEEASHAESSRGDRKSPSLRSDTLVSLILRNSLLGRDPTNLICRLLRADCGSATRKQYGDIE